MACKGSVLLSVNTPTLSMLNIFIAGIPYAFVATNPCLMSSSIPVGRQWKLWTAWWPANFIQAWACDFVNCPPRKGSNTCGFFTILLILQEPASFFFLYWILELDARESPLFIQIKDSRQEAGERQSMLHQACIVSPTSLESAESVDKKRARVKLYRFVWERTVFRTILFDVFDCSRILFAPWIDQLELMTWQLLPERL